MKHAVRNFLLISSLLFSFFFHLLFFFFSHFFLLFFWVSSSSDFFYFYLQFSVSHFTFLLPLPQPSILISSSFITCGFSILHLSACENCSPEHCSTHTDGLLFMCYCSLPAVLNAHKYITQTLPHSGANTLVNMDLSWLAGIILHSCGCVWISSAMKTMAGDIHHQVQSDSQYSVSLGIVYLQSSRKVCLPLLMIHA